MSSPSAGSKRSRGTQVSSKHPLLEGLNPQQIAAITADLAPALVLAGPGSGKTSVLTRRIAWLIQEHHVPHHRIMAVTFTNKAAGEMRSRVEKLLDSKLRGLQIGTFHSTCARFLRRDAQALGYRDNWVIYDSDDQLALIKRVLKVLDMEATAAFARQMQNRISRAKCEMVPPDAYSGDADTRRVYIAYQNGLKIANAMDFDDLLWNMVLVLQRNDSRRRHYQQRFEAVLVDEFQDTNTVQYVLVKLLAVPQRVVFVVGDEDQSIYRFRGADYRNLRRFRTHYPECQQFLLEQNYRSTSNIVNFARAVIDKNPGRTPKALHSDLGDGARVRLAEVYDNERQADYVCENIYRLRQNQGLDYKDIAVMYRSNWLSRAIEQMLVREQIPYVMIGGVGFFKRREVKDMLAYLRLVYNPDDTSSFGRIINTPKRGVGDKSVAAFRAWAELEGMSLGEALARIPELAPAALSSVARRRIQQFATLWAGWRELAVNGELVKLFERIYAESQYEAHLRKISDSEEQYDERKENINEIWKMLGRADDLGQDLGEFLAEQSLYADVDDLEEGEDRITLITLHSAKGLEFPAVFLVNVDETVLPNWRALQEEGGVEEERRLFYVGITRAERFLLLDYTFENGPSQFLFGLPPQLLDARPSVLSLLESSSVLNEPGEQWGARQPRHRIFTRPQPAAAHPVPRPARPQPQTGNAAVRAQFAAFKAPQKPTLRIGSRATHKQFGGGLVIGIDPGGDIVSMSFDDHQLKKVFAEDLTPLVE